MFIILTINRTLSSMGPDAEHSTCTKQPQVDLVSTSTRVPPGYDMCVTCAQQIKVLYKNPIGHNDYMAADIYM